MPQHYGLVIGAVCNWLFCWLIPGPCLDAIGIQNGWNRLGQWNLLIPLLLLHLFAAGIYMVHACMTKTLDCSKVDSVFSSIVMTDLDCHTVNVIDSIKVGQQNSKLPFHSCSHYGIKTHYFISLQSNIWRGVLSITLFILKRMSKPGISSFIYHHNFLSQYHWHDHV